MLPWTESFWNSINVHCRHLWDLLEKEMATHSRILAWRTPWTEEPGGLQSVGSQRVGHDWATDTYILMYHQAVFWSSSKSCYSKLLHVFSAKNFPSNTVGWTLWLLLGKTKERQMVLLEIVMLEYLLLSTGSWGYTGMAPDCLLKLLAILKLLLLNTSMWV